MAEPTRSIEQLKLLIATADRLGFYDDVAHWENELNKLMNPAAAL